MPDNIEIIRKGLQVANPGGPNRSRVLETALIALDAVQAQLSEMEKVVGESDKEKQRVEGEAKKLDHRVKALEAAMRRAKLIDSDGNDIWTEEPVR